MFSGLQSVTFIRDLMREMFREYGGEDHSWTEDPKESGIRIGTVNDYHTDAKVQQLPRLLIQRGPCGVSSQFIGNNFEGRTGGGIARGGTDSYRQDVQGSINIIIEAENEGTCEELAEFTRKFLCWCKPFIESKFGFQAFGKQFSMSTCDPDREDTEKFKISISIPFIVEDRWTVEGNFTRLNHIFHGLTNNGVGHT